MSTLELLGRRPITFSSAARKDYDVLSLSTHVQAQEQLYQGLWNCRETICALTRHHLRLGERVGCKVNPIQTWICGSFNVCVPIDVQQHNTVKKYLLRCPLPFKLAEASYPGTVDEKLASEVGTYAWFQAHCADIRIPFLHGFGFSDHRYFTHEIHRPIYTRLARCFWRSLYRALGRTRLTHYVPHHSSLYLPTAYMLLEYIDSSVGEMLSNTWHEHGHDQIYTRRLFQGISRVMLSLAHTPQSKIGSLRFNGDCTVTLSNRPLTCTTAILENNGAPRTITQSDTFSDSRPFVSHLLTLQDQSFISNENAVDSQADCYSQMTVLTLLRAISHHFIRPERRCGPFPLQFTDLHQSNIFVDEDWNVTCLIDLEWVCSLPTEQLTAPYWLTGRSIDELVGEDLEEYDRVRIEFMTEFKKEELRISGHSTWLTESMDDVWASKGTWFWHCVQSVNARLFLFDDHISPLFSCNLGSDADEILFKFWRPDADEVVAKKVVDNQQYMANLRRTFGREQ